MNDIGVIEKAIEQNTNDVKKFIEASEQKTAGISDRMFLLEQKMSEPNYLGNTGEPGSIADKVLAHSNYKSFMDGGAPSVRLTIPRPAFATKAIITSTTATVQASRQAGVVVPGPQRKLSIRDLLPSTETSAGSIEYTRELTFTNAAAAQVEGALKPESAMTFDLVTAPVRTLAHWLPASKQVLDDAPALREHIDRRMVFGLSLVEENQILAGDGTGVNLLGLIPQATSYNTALTVIGDSKIDRIRRAILQIELADGVPNGVILNPTDWAQMETMKASDDTYIMGNPNDGAATRLWQRGVVVSTAIAAGTFLAGDFQNGAQIFDRQEITVQFSTEDRDNFIRNAVTIRAECRLALAVYRPLLFVTGSFA